MEEPKRYRVMYHLGSGIEAAVIVEAQSAKEAACNLDCGETKMFTGENDTFFKFKVDDVKMISVKELPDSRNQAVL